MNSDWIAAQIIGGMFALGGLYLIGDWRIICGMFLLWMAAGICRSVPRTGVMRPDPNDKNWVE